MLCTPWEISPIYKMVTLENLRGLNMSEWICESVRRLQAAWQPRATLPPRPNLRPGKKEGVGLPFKYFTKSITSKHEISFTSQYFSITMLNWTSWARSRGLKARPNDDLRPICGQLAHISTLSISIKHNRTSDQFGWSYKCPPLEIVSRLTGWYCRSPGCAIFPILSLLAGKYWF